MQYTIHTPISGHTLKLEGSFQGIMLFDGHPGLMFFTKGPQGSEAFVMDPRAIVDDESGKRVYAPSQATLTGAPELKKWLRDNPEWVK